MEAAATHSLGGTHTGANRWLIPFLPSLTDFAFLWPVLLLFVLLPGSSVLLSDGDTGWHIRTGEWIWQHKAIPTTDLFSFTKPHDSWFAWEWGWDLLFAGIHHFGGLGGVAFASVIILCAISALLFRLICRYSENDFLSLAFTAFAIFGSVIHWLARPHLISWLFALIFAHLILSAEKGNTKALCWLPALMVLWVNLHGAFFVGIIMLLTSAVGEVLAALFRNEPFGTTAWAKAQPYGSCTLACSVVTFINPYTWHLHWHIFHYVQDAKLLSTNAEFQPISFHHWASLPFECMLLLGVGTIFWCARHCRFGPALLILLWAHWSLLSARNIPFFLLLSTPLIAQFTNTALKDLMKVQRLKGIASSITSFGCEFRPFEQSPHVYLASLLGLTGVACCFALERPGFESQLNPRNFPVQALPFIKAAKFSRPFTTDQWGDYLIYHLYPAQRVYVDGRGDFFGADFLEKYTQIVNARRDWETNLRAQSVDAVVLPPGAPVVSTLKESKNWKLLFDNGSTVIFQAVSMAQAQQDGVIKPAQVSPVACSGRKPLGSGVPSASLNSTTTFQERKGS